MTLAKFKTAVKLMTVPELLIALKERFTHVSETIMEMAVIWAELECKGYHTSEITTPFLSFLPDVASGKLVPEILLRYASNPGLVAVLSRLNPEDQRPLADPNALLSVANHEGKAESKRVHEVPLFQFERQLIHEREGRIRTIAEQQSYLPAAPKARAAYVEELKPKPATERAEMKSEPVAWWTMDPEDAIDDDEPTVASEDVAAAMSAEQHMVWLARASDAGVTPARWMVDYFVSVGIFPATPAKRAGRRPATRKEARP